MHSPSNRKSTCSLEKNPSVPKAVWILLFSVLVHGICLAFVHYFGKQAAPAKSIPAAKITLVQPQSLITKTTVGQPLPLALKHPQAPTGAIPQIELPQAKFRYPQLEVVSATPSLLLNHDFFPSVRQSVAPQQTEHLLRWEPNSSTPIVWSTALLELAMPLHTDLQAELNTILQAEIETPFSIQIGVEAQTGKTAFVLVPPYLPTTTRQQLHSFCQKLTFAQNTSSKAYIFGNLTIHK